jgi:hypothetical protein
MNTGTVDAPGFVQVTKLPAKLDITENVNTRKNEFDEEFDSASASTSDSEFELESDDESAPAPEPEPEPATENASDKLQGEGEGDADADSDIGEDDVDTDSASSVSTTELLGRDPLFLVLSQFLMNDVTGNNLVHVLEGISDKLSAVVDSITSLEQTVKKSMKKNENVAVPNA